MTPARVRALSWTSEVGCGALGLAQYEAAFRENAINEAILPKLTAEDLKDIGVTAVGHRRVLLDAIAALRGETPPKHENAPSAATEPANKPNRIGGGLRS